MLKVKVFIKLCSALLNSSSVVSVTSQDVCGSHLLEGRSNVLVAAVNELPAGDVIGDKLGLSPVVITLNEKTSLFFFWAG